MHFQKKIVAVRGVTSTPRSRVSILVVHISDQSIPFDTEAHPFNFKREKAFFQFIY